MTTLNKTIAFRVEGGWITNLDVIATRENMSRGQLLRNLVLTMFLYEMECFMTGRPSRLFDLSEITPGADDFDAE
jgi:hypothetical protein